MGQITRELADFLEGNVHEYYMAFAHRTPTFKNITLRKASFSPGAIIGNYFD